MKSYRQKPRNWIFCITVFLMLSAPLIASAAGGFETSADHLPSENCPPPGEPCVLTLEEPGASKFLGQWKKTDDPRSDGWDTEVFNDQAGAQLYALGKLILHPKHSDLKALTALITEDFSADPLAPEKLTTVFQDDNFIVERETAEPSQSSRFKGASGLLTALEKMSGPFAETRDLRFKFKLFFIEKSADTIVSTQYFALSGETDHGAMEQNATWKITWRPAQGTQPPLMQKIEVESFEQVSLLHRGGKMFVDVTASALGQNPSYQQQILRGLPQHLRSMEDVQSFAIFGTPGLVVGDINNDGLDDVYLCQEEGLPNRLYLHQSDGSVTDVSSGSKTDWLQSSRSALLIDFDNDADQDLAVAVQSAVVFAENDGQGHFNIRTIVPVNDDTMSMAATDFDNDGDVDVYVTAYNPNQRLEADATNDIGGSFVYHDANNGPGNSLLRNDSSSAQSWLFTDVTKEVGLNVNNRRFSLAVAWEDYDNDGDMDLYVANDYGRDNLYRNELYPSGKPWFSDVSESAAIENSAGGMSITWGDYNRDGLMDLYLSGMWSSAGNRITFQDEFKSDDPQVKQRLQKFARGNALYLNQGDGSFADSSKTAGVEMGRWAWGSQFVDLNNDGWEDLVVANGFLSGENKGGDL